MIYFEDKISIIEFNSKEAVVIKRISNVGDPFWSLYVISKYRTYVGVCNADTPEELYVWADLNGLKIVKMN